MGCAGLVAERVFGFQGSLADHGAPDLALQLANAHALGNSLLILLLVPWGLDFLFYCGAPCPRQPSMKCVRAPLHGYKYARALTAVLS